MFAQLAVQHEILGTRERCAFRNLFAPLAGGARVTPFSLLSVALGVTHTR